MHKYKTKNDNRFIWEKRFQRVFSILVNLSPHSQETVESLAVQSGCDRAQIERDVSILEQSGLGIYIDDEGRIKLMHNGYNRVLMWLRGYSAEEARGKRKAYRERNREKIRRIKNRYWQKNRERLKENCRQYYVAHRRSLLAKQRERYAEKVLEQLPEASV